MPVNSIFKQKRTSQTTFNVKVNQSILDRYDKVKADLQELDPSLVFDVNDDMAKFLSKRVALAEKELQQLKAENGQGTSIGKPDSQE